MAGRVQCRYGQGKMYIHVLLEGVDPENFPGEGGGVHYYHQEDFICWFQGLFLVTFQSQFDASQSFQKQASSQVKGF